MMITYEPFFDPRRDRWRIQYTNPGSKQIQAVYNAKNEMVEFVSQAAAEMACEKLALNPNYFREVSDG